MYENITRKLSTQNFPNYGMIFHGTMKFIQQKLRAISVESVISVKNGENFRIMRKFGKDFNLEK